MIPILNLFKYYAPKYKASYNLSFYEQKQIYFQTPKNFNDPWDCKAPEIKVPRQLSSLKYLWGTMPEDMWQKIKEHPRRDIKQQLSEAYKKALEEQRDKIGIYSLSCIPDSELMWAHYADSHSGYMLHFQIDFNQYFNDSKFKDTGVPVPVRYKDARESWALLDYKKDKDKHIRNLITFKSSAWTYEREIRFFHPKKNGFIDIPDNWLKSIIVGINTKPPLQKKLEDIGRKLKIPLFYSTMSKKEFKVEIPGLGINTKDGINQYDKLLNDGTW